jgi:hypothetical protein
MLGTGAKKKDLCRHDGGREVGKESQLSVPEGNMMAEMHIVLPSCRRGPMGPLRPIEVRHDYQQIDLQITKVGHRRFGARCSLFSVPPCSFFLAPHMPPIMPHLPPQCANP